MTACCYSANRAIAGESLKMMEFRQCSRPGHSVNPKPETSCMKSGRGRLSWFQCVGGRGETGASPTCRSRMACRASKQMRGRFKPIIIVYDNGDMWTLALACCCFRPRRA